MNKIIDILKYEKEVDNIFISGWLKTKRDSKLFSFLEINDGSCLKNLQVIVNNDVHNYSNIKKITVGSSISVFGFLSYSKGFGQKWDLIATKIKIINIAGKDYPLQKKRHSDEFLRSVAHLRPRTNKYGSIFRIRSNVSWAIHNFFKNKQFYYINTPILTSSDCEGAGETFKVTTLNCEKEFVKKEKIKKTKKFFGSDVNLTVSGQLSAEMFALSLGNVYTFGPTFRAENSNTRRHISEFWMLEPEMAFYDIDDTVNLAEELIKYLIDYVLSECVEDFELFNKYVNTSLKNMLKNIIKFDFVRVDYKEVINILLKSSESFKFKVEYGLDLQLEHERYITEKYFKKPVVIYNYPKSIKPFYMRVNDDNCTVAAMDIIVPNIGEIIGGSQREERFDFLIDRINESSLSKKNYWWYIDSRKYGSAVHSGFGMGFERFLMLVTGISNIRDVIPFPRTPGSIEF